MNYPGDQAQQIEDYLRAKGEDGPRVSENAYKAALRIAALGIIPPDDECDHQYTEVLSGVKCIKCGHFIGNWET